MHKEILTAKQTGLLPVIKTFSKDFGLVGGTAIALYIGHRQSIDFDLFSLKMFDYSGKVIFMKGFEIEDSIITRELKKISVA